MTEIALNEAVACLVPYTLTGIDRDGLTGVFAFATRESLTPGAVLQAHCPFRMTHGGDLVLGSEDMRWPKARGADPVVALADSTTRYDAQARELCGRLGDHPLDVVRSTLGDGGRVTVEMEDAWVLEVLPVTSEPAESWRVFFRGGDHVSYRGTP
ncbi:hypothetical protein ACIP98_26710 [Streptomyces sp. NPDC088354]|uniref:hypothetical protein n=1 Tax=unclassified Streptomyces TaxID=2593676 RepID=UPI0029B0B2B5|nr:hypothetical protein [Streptomyces sp. MI02-7b]MDX3071921.1 hypothetical protein [Streptomyces sp. MI02-7b]